MPLHPDTVSFLEARKAIRDRAAQPAPEEEEGTGGTTAGDVDEDGGTTILEDGFGAINLNLGEGIDDAPGAGDDDGDDCNIAARGAGGGGDDDEEGPCADVNPGALSEIENLCDPNGWPNCDKAYEDLQALLARAKSTPNNDDSMDEVFRLQRQINVMESYRKMLVHKKQGICSFLTIWCQGLKNCTTPLERELEALMLNQQVGTSTEANDDEDEDEDAEDEEAT